MLNVSGKKALVTGGAVRIGRTICEILARAGCHVAIQYRNSADEALGLIRELEGFGVQATAIQADLRNAESLASLVPEAARQLGGLDILVNNAAVFHKTDLLASSPDVLQSELDVNALAPIALMRCFAELHQDRTCKTWPEAAIINILDRRVAGLEKGAFPYVLSKNMLRDATQLAALELGPCIAVNAVAPGPILPPPGEGEEYLKDRAGPMVLAQRPTPKDIAKAVFFLLEADGVTGQVLFVDSGQHLL